MLIYSGVEQDEIFENKIVDRLILDHDWYWKCPQSALQANHKGSSI